MSEQLAQLSSSLPSSPGLADEVRRLRVGGSYWAGQPKLPLDYILVRSTAAIHAARQVTGARVLLLWTEHETAEDVPGVQIISGQCDPWHMLESASVLFAEPDDELCIIAALCGVSTYVRNTETGQYKLQRTDGSELVSRAILDEAFENPFTGETMTSLEAVRLCGFWRNLIDSNRDITGALGFAFWKQEHVAPLLWEGTGDVRFLRSAKVPEAEGSIAVWRSKASPRILAQMERAKVSLIEVEDGFLRSRGLGADCIPPLSLTVDREGAYFDPSKPSELELLLQNQTFDEQLLARARNLRRLIVGAGLGKYERGGGGIVRPAGHRRHVLVPGQVEDDRAVRLGGCGLESNLDLLKRVRDHAPDAYILYKPHPDVLAGHRRGVISERLCLQYADEQAGELPIASLIEMVDEVHVNTSLAGFEALLREKPVTTYGVPFYAGWGLTEDMGSIPARRTARRTIDELVGATLLLYPRYLDPTTGLPCPAEVLVSRLSACEEDDQGLLVRMRRLQGKFMRRLRTLVQ